MPSDNRTRSMALRRAGKKAVAASKVANIAANMATLAEEWPIPGRDFPLIFFLEISIS